MAAADEPHACSTSPAALLSDGDSIATHDDHCSDSVDPIGTEIKRQLEEAIRNDDPNELKKLLGSRDDLLEIPLQYELTKDDKTYILDVTPLALAAALNKTSIAKLLLERKANVNSEVSIIGGTALHLATRNGHKDIVDLLLSEDVDVNQRDRERYTPLHLASINGHREIATCLLDMGADLSLRGKEGHTPFHVASLCGHLEILELLLERGPKEQASEKNDYLFEPLHLACFNNRYEIVEWMLATLKVAVDQPGEAGLTALHLACGEGHTETIERLINYKADIHKRDDNSRTPILYSCFKAQLQSLFMLRNFSASVSDVDKGEYTCFHQVVLSDKEFSDETRRIVNFLISEGGRDINRPDAHGRSPLAFACLKQKPQHVRCFLDSGAAVNEKNPLNLCTALMEACFLPSTEIVNLLLQRGADMTLVHNNGLTALDFACIKGHLGNVKALISKGVNVTARSNDGVTPLCTAVSNQKFDVALELLATSTYFPENPTKEKAFTERSIGIGGVRKIENGLLKSLGNNDDRYKENEERLLAILHWAVANGALKLAQRCIALRPQVLRSKPKRQSDATWLHVVALYGQHEFIQLFPPETNVQATVEGNITPLHIAAVDGSVETAQCLLEMISGQPQKVMAIIYENNHGDSPLSISISRKHRDLEELFWTAIRQLGTTNKNFTQSNPADARRILELLAKYERPGHEVVLKELLQQWFQRGDDEGQRNFTALHWAVYHSQAVVVWWLLSKGGYLSSNNVEIAQTIIPYQHHGDAVARSLVRKLLLNPPPILDRVANPNMDKITLSPALVDEKNPALKIQGTVVDIYLDNGMVSIPFAKSSLHDIIYGRGPNSLMKQARENLDQRDLDALKNKLPGYSPNVHPRKSISSQHVTDAHKECLNDISGELRLRWVHLPVNELHLMRDLVCRLSHESNRLEMDHIALMKHLNRSWTELAAGGGHNYMKAQCMGDGICHTDRLNIHSREGQLSGKRFTCTALYMPYLTVGSYPGTSSKSDTNESDGLEESIYSRNSRKIKHSPITLDQYYYASIADTNGRDNDQVVSKYLIKKDEQQTKDEHKTILMVNQVWIWIIDENTIITATAEDSSQESTQNLLQTTLENMSYGDTKSRFERPTSVQSVMELVLRVATGSFMEKSIPMIAAGSKKQIKKAPIEIFRESIRDVADDETRLFRHFLAGLRHEASQAKSQTGPTRENRYHIISSETELLDQIRDIRDELHILKSLADDQDVVWKQAFPPRHSGNQLQYYRSHTPIDVKKDIEELLVEAETITNYINTLLDLRQAEYNRTQANIVFIFTVITIVFLPLSFLSSLFALDVSSFPHKGDDLKYEGKWLFPIIFGVTAVVSIPTIAFAWNVNAISEWLRSRTGERSTGRTAAAAAEARLDDTARQSTTTLWDKSLKRRWRKVEENALPQYEDY
ncbi:hypothetical protein F4775DRAFT_568507 [Biscogniauxia sp. FL1348]|nr:hypothetical protein F4775DRAFT_568507 [Biscogniauxia sp. FL1348]